ncbi:hypothetical protein HDV05_002195, partial [Chytridiales sp. JEL 0842]
MIANTYTLFTLAALLTSPATLLAVPMPHHPVPDAPMPFEYPHGASDVSVVRTNSLSSCTSTSCTLSFQAEIAVKNLAFKKSVGIRYSTDDWKTNQEVLATFDRPIEGGFEIWKVDYTGKPIEGISSVIDLPETHIAAFASFADKP